MRFPTLVLNDGCVENMLHRGQQDITAVTKMSREGGRTSVQGEGYKRWSTSGYILRIKQQYALVMNVEHE